MKKKRKIEDSPTKNRERDVSPLKKGKVKDAKQFYSEIEFKVELRDTNTTFLALQKFVEQARRYSMDGGSDIVANFCRTSAECREILSLLEGGKRKSEEIAQIFEALECILLRTADDLSKFKVTSRHITREIISGHMASIYYLLHGRSKPVHSRSALRLLSAMVSQGDAAAKEVQMHFDFTHANVWASFDRIDTKLQPDVRSSLIQFLVSLLLHGDNQVVKQLVDIKGFLNAVFPKLKGDQYLTLQMLLHVLKEQIVENPSITKTAKIRLFNDKTMRDLSQLYWWKEPDRRCGESGEQFEVTENESSVHQMTHSLLTTLCCSNKLGINFLDKSHGTSGRNMNHILTNFLTSLMKLYSDPLVQDLVVQTLRACPDQIHWVLPPLRHLFVPRPTINWKNCMQLLAKVYEAQPDVLPVLRVHHSAPVSQMVTMVMASLFPPKDIWSQVYTALKSKQSAVQFEAYNVVAVVTRGVLRTWQTCGDVNQTTILTRYDKTQREEIQVLVKEAASKQLPDASRLTRSLASLIGDVRAEEKEDDSSSDSDEEDRAESGLEEVASVALSARVLPILADYHQLGIIDHDKQSLYTSLLDGVHQLDSQDPVAAGLRLQVLRLLAASDARTIPWSQKTSCGITVLAHLLEIVRSSHGDPSIAKVTVQHAQKMLASTGLFEQNAEDLQIWLKRLQGTSQQEASHVTRFMEEVLLGLFQDPYPYLDQISDWVSEAGQSEQESRKDTENVATTDKIKQSILASDPVDLTEEREPQNINHVVATTLRYPFSAIVPAALDIIQKNQPHKVPHTDVLKFTEEALLEVASLQMHPVTLSHGFSQYSLSHQMPRLHAFLSHWSPVMNQDKENWAPGGVEEVLAGWYTLPDLLLATFELGPSCLSKVKDKVMEAVDGTFDEDRLPVIKQVLLYLTYYTSKLKQTKSDAQVGVQFYNDILLRVVQTSHTEQVSENSTAAMMDIETENTNSLMETEENESSTDMTKTESGLPSKVQSEVIFKYILEHPLMTKWFLREFSGKLPKLEKQHAILLTNTVMTIIGCMTQKTQNACRNMIDFYANRVIDALRVGGVLSKEGDNIEEKLQVLSEQLVTTVACFHSYFSLSDLKCVCRYFLNFSIHEDQTSEMITNCLTQLVQTISKQTKSRHPLNILESDLVDSMLQFVAATSVGEIHTEIFEMLQNTPLSGTALTEYQFTALIKGAVPEKLDFISLSMRTSPACQKWFETWVQQHPSRLKKNLTKLMPMMTDYLSLKGRTDPVVVNNLYQTAGPALFNLLSEQSTISKHQMSALNALFQVIPQQEAQSCFHQVIQLMKNSSDISVHQMAVLELLVKRLKNDAAETRDALPKEAGMVLLQSLNKKMMMKKQRDAEAEKICIGKCRTFVEDLDEAELSMAGLDGTKFIRNCLRYHFTNADMLHIVHHLVGVNSNQPIDGATVHNMILSHSQFLTIMMDSKDDKLKGSLIDLLTSLCQREPRCCKSSHVGLLFAAYTGSLRVTDQKILKLIQMYENNGAKMQEHRPYIWGKQALDHYLARKSAGPSLLKQTPPDKVLEVIDEALMLRSALSFPLRRTVNVDNIQTGEEAKSSEDCYDPAFILPMFAHLLGPENIVHCKKFIEKNCLGYTLAALSSHHGDMRSLAYLTLTRLWRHLEGAKFAEKDQVMYVLSCVRRSLEKPNQKLACIISVFLIKAVQLLLQPEVYMYQPITTFLLVKPTVDPLSVPDFFKLFYSSALEYKTERAWILALLREGLRETADYRIFEKKYTFKFLQSFFSSTISDSFTRGQVLDVIRRAVGEKVVAMDLVKQHGFVVWLDGVITQSTSNIPEQTSLCHILHDLWFTMLSQRDKHSGSDGQDSSYFKACLPHQFTNQMLHAMYTMLKQLASHHCSKDTVDTFLKALSSMLTHLVKSEQYLDGQLEFVAWNKICSLQALDLLWLWCRYVGDDVLKSQLNSMAKMVEMKDTTIKTIKKPWQIHVKPSEETEQSMLYVINCVCNWSPALEAASADAAAVLHIAMVTIFSIQWMLYQTLSLSSPGKHKQDLMTPALLNITKFISSALKNEMLHSAIVKYIFDTSAGAKATLDLLLSCYQQCQVPQNITENPIARSEQGMGLQLLNSLNQVFISLLDKQDVPQNAASAFKKLRTCHTEREAQDLSHVIKQLLWVKTS